MVVLIYLCPISSWIVRRSIPDSKGAWRNNASVYGCLSPCDSCLFSGFVIDALRSGNIHGLIPVSSENSHIVGRYTLRRPASLPKDAGKDGVSIFVALGLLNADGHARSVDMLRLQAHHLTDP